MEGREFLSFINCYHYGSRLLISTFARRVPFTPEDDEHLARYIARKLPDVDAGGRKGDAIYLWLYEVVNIHSRWLRFSVDLTRVTNL